jgi:NitT/TauT family transport system substrate-binding protein
MRSAPLGQMKILAPVPRATTNFAPVWLAEALGFAADEGLDYKIELAGTPKDAADGVASGRADTTFVNVVFALLARDRGILLRPYYAFVRAQNRAFSVPEKSPLHALSDLRGKTVGLHYDDPELLDFARAALRGAGIDPETEVSFKKLPGTPLDAPRMASAIREGEVDAVWQLDVLAGLMEAEDVPLRRLPSELIDTLTPSSCLHALDENLEARANAFGALGRALAKATLFALSNPKEAIRLMWNIYPDSAPLPGRDKDRAFRGELGALTARLEAQRIDKAAVAKWGVITKEEIDAWQEFLLRTGAIRSRRDASVYFSDALVDDFNGFDAKLVVSQARSFHS